MGPFTDFRAYLNVFGILILDLRVVIGGVKSWYSDSNFFIKFEEELSSRVW